MTASLMWRRILLHTCFQPNITDWTCTAWFPLGENHIWGRTVFPFSFLNKFQKPTENRFLTETWQKSLQLWERNLKCVLRKSCSPRLATLLTRDWGIIQRWRVWWSKSFERKKGVQAWNSVKYFHPCYAEISIAQHGKSMLLQNHIEYFKKKSEFAQRLRLDPEMKRIQNLTRTNGGAA